jgi:3-isopropylmalate/(R)-2-methylmalate dehydratase large subunit
MARTLFDKLWDAHVVSQDDGCPALLYIDLHLVHEVTSPQAFSACASAASACAGPSARWRRWTIRRRRRRAEGHPDGEAAKQLDTLTKNCSDFGVKLYGLDSDKRASCTSWVPSSASRSRG